MKTKLAAAVIGSMAIFNIGAAVSSPIADASASFDWSTFSVSGLTTLDSNYYSLVNASYNADSATNSAGDWVSPLSISSGSQVTWSQADANASVLHSYVNDNDTLSTGGVVSSNAYREWNFLAAENGNVTFSINYNLNTTLVPGDNNPDNFTFAKVALGWLDADGNTIDSLNDTLDLAGNKFGTFTYTLAVFAGQAYTFSADTYASANVSAVPLPSAVWLFLSAMMGFLGLSRRKSALIA